MTLKDFYAKAVRVGMENDPRGVDAAKADMAAAKKQYGELKEKEREYFDVARLENPYADTRILNGPEEVELKRIMAGIDMGEGELVLADRLNEKGRGIDAVITHHPGGHALAQLPLVMNIQSGIYASVGVPIGQAESVLAPRIDEVTSRLQPVNHQRSTDAARLLELPFMCMHTVADNCVATFLADLFDNEKPEKLGDIMELLHAIPEFAIARREQTGPVLEVGKDKSSVGKVVVEMTGGTEGAKEMYAKLARSGVSTVVGMHYSKEHLEAAKEEHLNVVLAGHISSDNLGLNLLFDACFGDKVEVIQASGFRRVGRKPVEKPRISSD